MKIDFQHIIDAEKYYDVCGYTRLSVPWIVKEKAYSATKPSSAGRDFTTLDGNLVASGEQSFLQMLLDGKKIYKAQCSTPCFRDESHDEWHHPYFLKVELIQVLPGESLSNMINYAQRFFNKYLDTKIVKIAEDQYDIVDSEFDIELGSYGIREFEGFKWVYGTGVAEPRLTQVLGKRMMFV